MLRPLSSSGIDLNVASLSANEFPVMPVVAGAGTFPCSSGASGTGVASAVGPSLNWQFAHTIRVVSGPTHDAHIKFLHVVHVPL